MKTGIKFEKAVTKTEMNCYRSFNSLSTVPETKIAKFAHSIDLDEVAHNEPPHLDLHCLNSQYVIAWTLNPLNPFSEYVSASSKLYHTENSKTREQRV